MIPLFAQDDMNAGKITEIDVTVDTFTDSALLSRALMNFLHHRKPNGDCQRCPQYPRHCISKSK